MTGSGTGEGRRSTVFPAFLLVPLAFLAAPLAGQDTLAVPDTLVQADTLLLPDTMVSDTLPADTIVRLLPRIPAGRTDEAPGVGAVPQRTGDFGTPQGMVFEGMAGGRLRVFIDGLEELPIDGSVVDLAQISLAGVESVRLSRAGGEIRIHLTSTQAREPQPESVLEVGTGDLDTNLFRGTFNHPDAFGGGLGLAFERLDTRGRGDAQDGFLQSLWLRYHRPLGDRFVLVGEVRRRTAATALGALAPPRTTRTDLDLRLRARLAEGLVAEAFAVQTALSLGSDDDDGDSLPSLETTVRQFGGQVGVDRGPVSLHAASRFIDGSAGADPFLRTDVDAAVASERWGGVAGYLGLDTGDDNGGVITGLSAWTGSVVGLSAYASLDQGERGWVPSLAAALGRIPDSLAVAPLTGSDRSALRIGGRFELGPVTLDGAWLRTEIDSVLPLGNGVDRGTVAYAGDEATGFEVSGRVGLWPRGLAVEGSLQKWDSEGFYRPERIYRGGLTFNRMFYPTGNLEFNAGVLVEGRDPMLLPLESPEGIGPARVPFYQSWNAHLLIRVVTVRLFVRWENLFLRANNQDLPGLLLPTTRVMYGVRWTLWN
ncbi:MAG: hypothetical protein P8188_16560 [Gemmatimonadota bacterium]